MSNPVALGAHGSPVDDERLGSDQEVDAEAVGHLGGARWRAA